MITTSDIIEATARHFEIEPADLTGPSREWVFSHPRQIAYLICNEVNGDSLPRIGQNFGWRDHSTVLSGIRAVKRRNCPDEMEAIRLIKEELLPAPTRRQVVNFMPVYQRPVTIKSLRFGAYE